MLQLQTLIMILSIHQWTHRMNWRSVMIAYSDAHTSNIDVIVLKYTNSRRCLKTLLSLIILRDSWCVSSLKNNYIVVVIRMWVLTKIYTFTWYFGISKLLVDSIICMIVPSIGILNGINSLWPRGLVKMGHFYHHIDVTEVLAISRRFGGRLWIFIGAHGLLRVLTF